jgi:hypothetical protein
MTSFRRSLPYDVMPRKTAAADPADAITALQVAASIYLNTALDRYGVPPLPPYHHGNE